MGNSGTPYQDTTTKLNLNGGTFSADRAALSPARGTATASVSSTTTWPTSSTPRRTTAPAQPLKMTTMARWTTPPTTTHMTLPTSTTDATTVTLATSTILFRSLFPLMMLVT